VISAVLSVVCAFAAVSCLFSSVIWSCRRCFSALLFDA
jgi:hypothetical protein